MASRRDAALSARLCALSTPRALMIVLNRYRGPQEEQDDAERVAAACCACLSELLALGTREAASSLRGSNSLPVLATLLQRCRTSRSVTSGAADRFLPVLLGALQGVLAYAPTLPADVARDLWGLLVRVLLACASSAPMAAEAALDSLRSLWVRPERPVTTMSTRVRLLEAATAAATASARTYQAIRQLAVDVLGEDAVPITAADARMASASEVQRFIAGYGGTDETSATAIQTAALQRLLDILADTHASAGLSPALLQNLLTSSRRAAKMRLDRRMQPDDVQLALKAAFACWGQARHARRTSWAPASHCLMHGSEHAAARVLLAGSLVEHLPRSARERWAPLAAQRAWYECVAFLSLCDACTKLLASGNRANELAVGLCHALGSQAPLPRPESFVSLAYAALHLLVSDDAVRDTLLQNGLSRLLTASIMDTSVPEDARVKIMNEASQAQLALGDTTRMVRGGLPLWSLFDILNRPREALPWLDCARVLRRFKPTRDCENFPICVERVCQLLSEVCRDFELGDDDTAALVIDAGIKSVKSATDPLITNGWALLRRAPIAEAYTDALVWCARRFDSKRELCLSVLHALARLWPDAADVMTYRYTPDLPCLAERVLLTLLAPAHGAADERGTLLAETGLQASMVEMLEQSRAGCGACYAPEVRRLLAGAAYQPPFSTDGALQDRLYAAVARCSLELTFEDFLWATRRFARDVNTSVIEGRFIPPSRISRRRDRLGGGGFGDVFVTGIITRRPGEGSGSSAPTQEEEVVVLKTARTAEDVFRLLQEASIVSQLTAVAEGERGGGGGNLEAVYAQRSHVQLKGVTFDAESGLPALLLEKLDGDVDHLASGDGSGDDEGGEGAFPMATALRVMGYAGYNLFNLHRHGIVHGDLKPQNVLWQRTGDGKWIVKLGDFGSAVRVTNTPLYPADSRELQVALRAGTAQYWAPEIIEAMMERRPWVATPASDMWAYGCMVAAVLRRNQPFRGDLTPEMREAMTAISDPAVREARPGEYVAALRKWHAALVKQGGLRPRLPDGCPAHVLEQLGKCWATDPSLRPTPMAVAGRLVHGPDGPRRAGRGSGRARGGSRRGAGPPGRGGGHGS